MDASTAHPVEKHRVTPTYYAQNAEMDGGYALQEIDGRRLRDELDESIAQTPKSYPGL
jgi:hypothetical protein